jgi:bacterioferritin (cytochrome b1)
VADEEGHQNEFERQLENIRRFGLSYLALQSFGTATAPEPA